MDKVRELGARALAAKTPTEVERLAMVEARLGVADWPERALRVTAIDCATGERVAWDRASGASVAQAVASSSAVPGMFPPVTINGRRYYDGGFSSPTCADLAIGSERVVIVAPIMGGTSTLGGLADRALATEVALLEAAGANVTRIYPDADATAAFGPDLMNPRQRRCAAQAGQRQGLQLAATVAAMWT